MVQGLSEVGTGSCFEVCGVKEVLRTERGFENQSTGVGAYGRRYL